MARFRGHVRAGRRRRRSTNPPAAIGVPASILQPYLEGEVAASLPQSAGRILNCLDAILTGAAPLADVSLGNAGQHS